MSSTKNKQKIELIANALLKNHRLERCDQPLIGKTSLVFVRGAAESPAYLSLSVATYCQSGTEIIHLFDKKEFNPAFTDQMNRLRGHIVSNLILEHESLIITFDSGETLYMSGDCKDPDGEGWSLHSRRLISVHQELLDGYPIASVPTWLAKVFPTSEDWGEDRAD